MAYALGGIVGMFLGAALGWLIAMKRAQADLLNTEHRVSSAEAKVASAEATAMELRRQSDEIRGKAAEDFERLRVELLRANEIRVRAETEREELSQRLEAEKKLLIDAKETLSDTFKALAGETLHKSTDSFLVLA